ncbi:hypothetical protein Vretifemale_3734 [Volvox reticuliferus]|nr:hypothetical protein Vretifemale_3734 [Volvox reticuliferus]
MRKYIREQLRRCGMPSVNLTSDKVVWCLTVPAIWSDAAKERMRDAAHRAGLTVQKDSRSLSLTLEPEAAALSAVIMGEAVTPGSVGLSAIDSGGVLTTCGSASNRLQNGDVLLVLDCGGGTADVTLHRVRGSGTSARLEEAAPGRGEQIAARPCGSGNAGYDCQPQINVHRSYSSCAPLGLLSVLTCRVDACSYAK